MARSSLDDVLDPPSHPGSRRDARRQQTRRRKRRKGWVAVLVTIALIGAACYGAYAGLKPLYESFNFGAPKDYEGIGTGQVTVVIPAGATGGAIGRILEADGVVMNASAFVDAAAVDPRATSIQPGTYAMHKQMSSPAALAILVDSQNRIVRQVTLREGLRASQIVDAMAKQGKFDKAEVKAAMKDADALGLPPAAKGKVEGFLFPSTYDFEPDTTAAEALKTMVDQTKSVLKKLGVPAAKQRELIIKASIVQAEGGSVKDFGKIARVIDNRLADGIRLQMDSNVAYGTGHFGIFTTAAERADTANLYNTYAHPGLPVGPISNPGKDAIKAVLKPPSGDWLFFVVVNLDTGETKFAATKAEHDRNVAQWRQWYDKNR